MTIDKYIAESRCNKKAPLMEKQYLSLYKEMCTEDEPYPVLKICYAIQKHCEYIRCGELEYIIYNQYLGQSFNMLNRIFYNSNDSFDAVVYSYKCFSEIFHYIGSSKMACLCYLAYAVNEDHAQGYKKEASVTSRAIATRIHEKFVLLHEIYHWKCSRMTPAQKNEIFSRKRKEILKYKITRQELSYEESAFAIIQDVIKAELSQLITEEDISPNRIKELAKELEKIDRTREQAELEMILRKDDIIEECLCDEYAFEQLLCTEPELSFEQVALITFLAIENLQTMTFMEIFAKDLGNGKGGSITEATIRKSAFRMCTVMTHAQDRQISLDEIHDQLKQANLRYSELIRDPIMFVTTEKLEEMNGINVENVEMKKIEDSIYEM